MQSISACVHKSFQGIVAIATDEREVEEEEELIEDGVNLQLY